MENPADETVSELQEELDDKATDARNDRFITRIALTTALIAAFAAVSGYLAGERADESLVDQIQASDQWSYYQAKSIKHAVLASKAEILQAMNPAAKEVSATDKEKLTQYDQELVEIKEKAEEKQHNSEHRLSQRKILANGVTFFQIAIAIGAIAAITRKRPLWYASLLFGAVGLVQLLHELFYS